MLRRQRQHELSRKDGSGRPADAPAGRYTATPGALKCKGSAASPPSPNVRNDAASGLRAGREATGTTQSDEAREAYLRDRHQPLRARAVLQSPRQLAPRLCMASNLPAGWTEASFSRREETLPYATAAARALGNRSLERSQRQRASPSSLGRFRLTKARARLCRALRLPCQRLFEHADGEALIVHESMGLWRLARHAAPRSPGRAGGAVWRIALKPNAIMAPSRSLYEEGMQSGQCSLSPGSRCTRASLFWERSRLPVRPEHWRRRRRGMPPESGALRVDAR